MPCCQLFPAACAGSSVHTGAKPTGVPIFTSFYLVLGISGVDIQLVCVGIFVLFSFWQGGEVEVTTPFPFLRTQ